MTSVPGSGAGYWMPLTRSWERPRQSESGRCLAQRALRAFALEQPLLQPKQSVCYHNGESRECQARKQGDVPALSRDGYDPKRAAEIAVHEEERHGHLSHELQESLISEDVPGQAVEVKHDGQRADEGERPDQGIQVTQNEDRNGEQYSPQSDSDPVACVGNPETELRQVTDGSFDQVDPPSVRRNRVQEHRSDHTGGCQEQQGGLAHSR